MWRICNQQTIDAPKILDEIEGNVYAVLKPLGFRKFGRTLHRFVSGDLSQVVNFQIWGDRFCVNLGIRVPECDERLNPPSNKKYYHEYSCTLRSRLGQVSGKHETWFDLRKKTEKTSKKIIKELLDIVIPSYEVLNSRNAILQKSGEYPNYWFTCELLDKCMIYLNMGDIEKAKECFEKQYKETEDWYNDWTINGHKQYLKKGERVVYMNQDITAKKSGYVTLYGASHAHIDYLNELGAKLGFR